MHVHAEPVHVAIARSEGDSAALREIEQCSVCRKAAETLDEWMILADHPDPLVGGEIQMCRHRLEVLQGLSIPEAQRKIDSDLEYPRWGLTRLMILKARRALRYEDRIEHALRLALLALYLAARLEPDFYGPDHCLRINLQAIETSCIVLAASLGDNELVRVLEGAFRSIYTMLKAHYGRSTTGPPA